MFFRRNGDGFKCTRELVRGVVQLTLIIVTYSTCGNILIILSFNRIDNSKVTRTIGHELG